MQFVSKTSGRTYDITEAVEPRATNKPETTDILIIFDWERGEVPIIVNYLFGAHFLHDIHNEIQEVITKYEVENNLI